MLPSELTLLQKQLEPYLQAKESIVIGIDGRCAAGKSTLASQLAERYDATVIPVDDFYLQAYQRTKERFNEPGGNMDRERLIKEVLHPLQCHQNFSYRPFDCKAMDFKEPRKIIFKKVMIIEGSYSLHPDLFDAYDFTIFLDIDAQTQKQRIQKRNPLQVDAFLNQWIPLEEKYFKAFSIQEKATITFQAKGF